MYCKYHMLIQRYHIIEELYREPKKKILIDCFLVNVNTNHLNDITLQQKKKNVSKKFSNIGALFRKIQEHQDSFFEIID